jgi:hypothetical protein
MRVCVKALLIRYEVHWYDLKQSDFQAKTYTISEKLSKERKIKNKNSASSPPIFIFFG